MYLDHFSLKIKPFQITADPKFLWLGEKHKEALATLRYGIVDNRGFLLLTGEVGTGKTILINRLITMLDMDSVVATLPDPDLESMDFYNMLADGFKMKRTFDGKGEFLIHLRDFLHQSYANQQQVLLIIDESQRLNHRLMEDIRVLSNIELHDRKLINIFFVGQQEFNSILMTPQNRALSQRITVRYHIEALDTKETGDYINHRLEVAGSKKNIFNDRAVAEVYQVSGGIPRLINIVCDHALLTAYANNKKAIDHNIIRECAEELRIPVYKPQAEAASVKLSPSKENNNVEKETSGLKIEKNNGVRNVTPEKDFSPKENSHIVRRTVYAIVIILLISGIGIAIHEFSGVKEPRYGEEDLTPQKYKTTLEKEKARLEDRLNDGGTNDNSTEKEATVPDNSSDKQKAEDTKPGDATAQKKSDKASIPDNGTAAQKAITTRKDGAVHKKDTGNTGTTDHKKPKDTTKAIEALPLMNEKVNIQFSINSNEIDKGSYNKLDKIADYLVNHPDVMIYVSGYTDDSGSPGYNKSVSRFRAGAVKSYLIGKGVHPGKITIFALGSVDPIAPNNSYEGRKRNRRVEIEFRQYETNKP